MGIIDSLKKTFSREVKMGMKGFVPFLSLSELYPTSKFTDYNSFLSAAQQISWVYKCCAIIGEATSMTKGYIYDKNENEVTNNAILNQIFMQPNDFMTWFEFIEGLTWYLNLTGNAYILKDEINQLKQPTKLWLLRPDKMEIIPSKTKFILGYQYDLDGTKIPFAKEDVIHFKLPNPRNEMYGMGKIEASKITYDTEIASATYNWMFFSNGASPSAILTNEGQMNDDAYNRLVKMFEKRHVGFKRMQKPLLLENGTEYKQMGLSQQDMAFIEQRKFSRDEIFSIFGVPPAKAGNLEYASYANVKEQENTFRKDTLKPLLTRIQQKLTIELVQLFDTRWKYEFEEVVVRDEAAYLLMATQAINSGIISPNEARELYLELPLVENEPMMDAHYMPFNLMEITGENAGAEEAVVITPAPVEPAIPVEEGKAIHNHKEQDSKKINAQQALLKISLATRKKLGKKIKQTAKTFFEQQSKRIVGELDGLTKENLDSRLFNEAELKEFQTVMVKTELPLIFAGFENIVDVMDREKSINRKAFSDNVRLKKIIKQIGKRVTEINDTTMEKLNKTLIEGLDAGESVIDLAKRINGPNGVMTMAENYRATMIARTESAFAYDKGAVVGYEEMGVEMLDVIGCEDNDYPCNSTGHTINEADDLEFHPNHTGTFVPA